MSATAITAEIRIMGHPACPGLFKKDAQAVPEKGSVCMQIPPVTPDLEKFIHDSGFPGMRVLEFAFNAHEESTYLPHAHIRNCVCYAGTHDNDTLIGWKKQANPEDIAKAIEYLGLSEHEGFVWGILRGGMSSGADLFIAQMQDYLELGTEARMNTPGTMFGNWQWRMLPNQNTAGLARRIRYMTRLYGRYRGK